MLLAAVIILVALLVASPYLVIVLKRAKMLKRITAVARRSGFRVRKLHVFVCFARNRAPRYDLLVEARGVAYAVKLWSATKKESTLFVRGDGTVVERVKARAVLDTGAAAPSQVSTGARRVPVTQNNFKVRRGKPVVSIMLYYPTNEKVILSLGNTQKRLSSGDRVLDKILCTPSYFEKMLADSAGEHKRQIQPLGKS